ncbi:unnamed protein product [marine sediment metagenome]|uniref:Uncharacterized protein n=1 Tax=marine sediment metagenome TaxID=412755 RepID=X1FVE9_9ZZZZ
MGSLLKSQDDDYDDSELGQSSPPPDPSGPPAGLTRDSINWAYEHGAEDAQDARDMIMKDTEKYG